MERPDGSKQKHKIRMDEATWRKEPSTKWTMLVKLLRRLLATDDPAFFPRWKQEGKHEYEGFLDYKETEFVGHEGQGTGKIVIYVEFVKTIHALEDVGG